MNDFEKYFEYKSGRNAAKAWKKRFDGFLKTLPDELCSYFFAYWPKMEAHRAKIEPELRKLAEYPSQEAYWAYYSARMNGSSEVPVSDDVAVPEKSSRDKAEQDLQRLLDEFPRLRNKAKYIQSFWNDFDENVKYENFFFGVHDKVKEVLAGFYGENIAELDGALIRRLDSDLYYLSAYEFARQALKLKSKVEEQIRNESGEDCLKQN